MSSKITKALSKNRAILALAMAAPGSITVASATLSPAFAAERATAGSFDLTKQATDATFPVMFDRPTGINASALAATVRNLGSDSEIYKKAVAAVPEIGNANTVQTLLSDAMSTDSAKSAQAKATIVKLINWYNSLGGQKITTQSGAAYTTANLDQPINVLAVAFADASINPTVSATVTNEFKNVRTVQDVMNIFDKYKAGSSDAYKSAFDAYAAKVYAPGADISALSEYSAVKPVLDAYEAMYANGASAIRAQLLNNNAGAKEAGVTFFESAVITGQVASSDAGSSSSNTPTQKTVRTRWVDDKGNNLAPEESGTDYKGQKTFEGYDFKEVETKDGVRTYHYTPKKTEAPKTKDTVWVDESGKVLRAKTTGTFPDNDGKSDIDGYELVRTNTTTDTAGNTHTVNTYKKIEAKELPDTYWFDSEGNTLKAKAVDQTLPDNDGKSDIPGYKVISVYTVNDKDIAKGGQFENSGFGAGDVINIYEKEKEAPKPKTRWVDKSGKELKETADGSHPDKEGDDIPGYTIVSVETDEDGNVVNTYEKTPEKKKPTTKWVDKSGKELKTPVEGTYPDKEGDDIPGYTIVSVETDEDGNVVNTYEKTPEKKTTTEWVDLEGKALKEKVDGSFPDNDGKSDIDGYVLDHVEVDTDGNVKNVYKKVETPKKNNTQWVDLEGKKLKEPVEGKFPDNDGKSDIDGYELVRVEIDEDGNVKNVYKKVAPKETPKPAPQPAPQLPKTGDASSIIGLVGSALVGTSGIGLSTALNNRRKRSRK